MHPPADRYADWKAPADDGQALVWPEPATLLRETRENAAGLSSAGAVRVQNVPLPELRRRMRQWIGHGDDATPLVATGHQAELHHPGVWVKNALIDATARALGGRAYHFAVDTDEPKHLHLRWPGGSEPLTDDPTAAEWSGLLRPPTPAHLRHVTDSLGAAASNWSFEPVARDVLASMRRLSLEDLTLPAALTNSLHELDWSLGLRHHAMTLSPLCYAEPYLALVHHVLARAGQFAAQYNDALDDYRRDHRVRTPGRPMPNLRAANDACEVPFWLDSLATGSRARASVERTGDGWSLRPPAGEPFTFRAEADAWDAAADLLRWMRLHNVRLAPRALTLTTVLRLLVADQFVHGIGGGRYDQVTDRLIERHFGLAAPRFSVTTATLVFPAAVGRTRVCMGCVRQDGHRLRHRVLGAEKDQMVEAIAALPRRSLQRSVLFHEMHAKLAAASDHPDIQEWEGQLKAAEEREVEEAVLFDRELFYGIQPRERLTGLVEQYRKLMSH